MPPHHHKRHLGQALLWASQSQCHVTPRNDTVRGGCQQNNTIRKRTKGLKRHFSKDIPMANKHTNKCPTSLVTVKMQIKTTMRRYYLPPSRMATITNTGNQCCEDAEKLKPLCIADGNGKGNSCCGKWHDDSSKKSNKKYHVLQQFHCWVSTQKK